MSQRAIAPDVAAFLSQVYASSPPSFADMSPIDARDAVKTLGAYFEAPADITVTTDDQTIDRPGEAPMRVRTFTPEGVDDNSAVIVFFHGGGWVTGDLDGYQSVCSFIAAKTGRRVISVDYRLAPEAPFPAAYDDALAAVRWVINIEGPLRHTAGVVLAGDSAGGNLAAAIAPALVADAIPVIAQFLLYPVLDLAGQTSSYEENGEGFLLTRGDMEYFISAYVTDDGQCFDSRCSPARAETFSNVPPTVILACGLDPLRDEARQYASNLTRAGVETHFIEASEHIHGMATLRAAMPSAEPILAHAVHTLALILDKQS